MRLGRQEKALLDTSRGLLYLFGVTKFLLPAKSVASERKKFVTLRWQFYGKLVSYFLSARRISITPGDGRLRESLGEA
jgi:hypothetical protein